MKMTEIISTTKSETPLVSIIIPVYNGSNYLDEAIESALNQTYGNTEIIVVNDGSNDCGKTREIALSYGKRIRYFEKKNGGVSSALNVGLRNMKGDYFSWLSHDDIYYPQKIQLEIDALRESGNMDQAVYSDYDFLFMPERRVVHYKGYQNRYMKRYVNSGVFAVNFGFISGCTLLIPRNYFQQYGLFNESLLKTQDYAKWFEMFREHDLLYVDEKLIQSRCHEQQGSVVYKNETREEKLLYTSIDEEITEEEMARYGVSLYDFYSMSLMDKTIRGKTFLCDDLREKLKTCKLSEEINEKRLRVKEKVEKRFEKGLYLYCMGHRGLLLQSIIDQRGLILKGFIDSDSKKWGKKSGGVECFSIDKIRNDVSIVVTKDNPEELVMEIQKKGYQDVIIFDDMIDILWQLSLDPKKL